MFTPTVHNINFSIFNLENIMNSTAIRIESSSKRIDLIDIIRGFALLGVIIVNACAFNSPSWMDEEANFAFQTTLLDEIFTRGVFFACVEKFVTIFAFLFGFSAAIFFRNMQERKLNAHFWHLKRMFFLLLFGILHVLFVWWGDILVIYSLMGMLLVLFFTLDGKKLFSLASIFLAVALILTTSVALQGESKNKESNKPDTPQVSKGISTNSVDTSNANDDGQDDSDDEDEEVDENDRNSAELVTLQEPTQDQPADMQMVYQTGSFIELIPIRVKHYLELNISGFFDDWESSFLFLSYYLRLFSFFLLGMGAMRLNLLQAIQNHLTCSKIICGCFLVIGILQNILYANSEFWFAAFAPVRGLGLAGFYFLALVILFQASIGKIILRPLQYLGRMTLTSYLSFSIMTSLLLYGYGLGLYGRVGPMTMTIIAAIYFIAFTTISHFWLRCFKQGPFEKVWRLLTYW